MVVKLTYRPTRKTGLAQLSEGAPLARAGEVTPYAVAIRPALFSAPNILIRVFQPA